MNLRASIPDVRGIGYRAGPPKRILPISPPRSNWHPSVLRKYIGPQPVAHKGYGDNPHCRELRLVAASRSERPLTANPVGNRVDFDTKGFWTVDVEAAGQTHMEARNVYATNRRKTLAVQNPPVWPFRLKLQSLVTERYPPYSRLAPERVPGCGWGSGRRTIAQRLNLC